jgi:hypothetical protein
MVFIGDGTPEGDKRAQRKNLKSRQLLDQTEAHIRDFYESLAPDEKAAFREYLISYKRLRNNIWYKAKYAALRQKLDTSIAQQPAHADVMQAGTKSLPTVDQLVSVVNGIEPLA